VSSHGNYFFLLVLYICIQHSRCHGMNSSESYNCFLFSWALSVPDSTGSISQQFFLAADMSACGFCGTACAADLPELALPSIMKYTRALNVHFGCAVVASSSTVVCSSCRTEANRTQRFSRQSNDVARLSSSETMLLDKTDEVRDARWWWSFARGAQSRSLNQVLPTCAPF
jgi:hypothetical protein